MQKKKLIPTPLLSPEERKVSVAPPHELRRVSMLRILAFFTYNLLAFRIHKISPRLFRRRSEEGPKRLRRFMERVGGVWIKAGQIIAMRRDFFSDRFCDELAR